MNIILARIICVLGGYVFGLFETGEVIAKSQNRDLRKEGSGNIGSTNSLRVLGVKAGIMTLVGDIGKCVLAMFISYLIFRDRFAADNAYRILMLYAGVGAILGHDYPFYHNFKGGKGVACVGGLALAFAPAIAGMAIAVFVIVVAICKFVSMGSMIAECSLFVFVVVFGQMGQLVKLEGPYLIETEIIFAWIAALCIFQHRTNIKRIIRKEEHPLSFKNAGKVKGPDVKEEENENS